MTEREQALRIANAWLEFEMNSLVQMVHGDPDCDACVLARQFVRAMDEIERLRAENGRLQGIIQFNQGGV